MLMPLILIFAIMYLLVFRPQARKQRDQRKMLDSLDKGDQILTAGGLYGTIVGIKKEHILIVKVADNVKLEISRTAIAQKIVPEEKKK